MKTVTLLIVLCSLPRFLMASDQDLRAQLTASYAHKGLFLRYPVRQNSQQYDSAGKLLSSSDEGPWTVYGPVEVTRVDLTHDKLSIIANRLIYTYDPKVHELLAHRQKHPAKVKIQIELGSRLNTLAEANAIIGRIFAANPAEIIASLPDYWRSYFQTQPGDTPGRASNSSSAGSEAGNSPKPVEKELGLARIGMKGVKRPEPLFTPPPQFTDLAREMKLQGTCVLKVIVGVDGMLHHVQVLRPLGAGLDEQAISTVETWKFKPATRDGQPVPVEMSLEIGFNFLN